MHFVLTAAEQQRVEMEVAAAHLLQITEGQEDNANQADALVSGEGDGEELSLLEGAMVN